MCLCTLSLRKMRCVNPNVSEEEEISDSIELRVPIFFLSLSLPFLLLLFTFGPLDALLTASWLREKREDLSG